MASSVTTPQPLAAASTASQCHYIALAAATSALLAFWVAFQLGGGSTGLPGEFRAAGTPVDPFDHAMRTPFKESRKYGKNRAAVDGEREIDDADLATSSNRSLSARGAKIRLCMGSPTAPFAQGTFVTKPIIMKKKKGATASNRYAQVTVFEAEVRHAEPLVKEDSGKPQRQARSSQTSLRLLSFLEDDESILKTQWKGWGEAELSELFGKGELKLKCHIWPGHDPYIQAFEPAYIVDVVPVWNMYFWHLILECLIPSYTSVTENDSTTSIALNDRLAGDDSEVADVAHAAPSPLSGASPTASPSLPVDLTTSSSVIGHERLRTVEGRQWAVHHWQQVQVQLVAAEAASGAELRMPPLLLCRADSDKHTLASSPHSLSLSTSSEIAAADADAAATQPLSVSSPPPFPFAAVERELLSAAAAAGAAGVAGEPGGKTAGAAEEAGGDGVAAAAPGAAGSLKEVGVPGESMGAVSICLRPFHTRQMFSDNIAVSDERLLEWIDASLLMGVDRVYVYDRYATAKRELLLPYMARGQVVHVPFPPWSEVFYRQDQFAGKGNNPYAAKRELLLPYMARGQVVHVPFPPWSEVFYRQDQFAGKGNNPYAFPDIYDQLISYEHCMMLGRRFGDRWQLQIDSDEFIWYLPRAGGFLKPLLARIELNHAQNSTEPLRAIHLRRFNVWGETKETRGECVTDRLMWRSKLPVFDNGMHRYHDKGGHPCHHSFGKLHSLSATREVLSLNHYKAGQIDPHLALSNNSMSVVEDQGLFCTVGIHATTAPENSTAVAPPEVLRLNHYMAGQIDLHLALSNDSMSVVEDQGLLCTVGIHATTAPENSTAVAPPEVLRLNHYTAGQIDLHFALSIDSKNVVEDQGALLVLQPHAGLPGTRPCGARDNPNTPVECWPFCQPPWDGHA
ncbi:unnamed protein product [Closterium sp. NIES-64]|nr:unnamed protein product [Closterium sp. NIES-64]